ncbi:MAG: TIGR01212 family radical SAM protein [Hyphomicrobiales bacterium]
MEENKKDTIIYPWGHERPFNSYALYFRRMLGERVQKLSIDAGFTCPNRDGNKGSGGCTFCNNSAFSPSYCQPSKSVAQQLEEGIEFHKNRYRRATKYLAYFQSFSNTYADLDHLKKIYQQAMDHPEVVGIVIGTRPDCIDERKLEYFGRLAEERYVIIEYGVESCYDRTLKRINRGHDFETSVKAIELTKDYGVKTGAHIIFGLPGESHEDMIQTSQIMSQLPLDNIKFHQLQVMHGTLMAEDYEQNPEDFKFFELDEYIQFISNYLETLNPNFVVERFASEAPPRYVLGSADWGLRNDQVVIEVEKELRRRGSYQGKRYL